MEITKGSRVEVSNGEEGFKDSWYVATVVGVDVNVKNSSQKKKKKSNMGYFVKYDTLFEEEEDSSIQLTEAVEASHVRPLPPWGEGVDFEVYDVVDAYHRDGWWTGVISKVVVDDVKSYIVSFQSPPEELKFQASHLRLHFDWVDRTSWVPRKKMGLLYSSYGVHLDYKSLNIMQIPNAKGNNDAHSGCRTPDQGALTTNHSQNPHVANQLSAENNNPSTEKADVNDKTVNPVKASFEIDCRNKRSVDSVEENLCAKRFQPSAGNKNGSTEDIDSGNASSKSLLHQDSRPVEQEIIETESKSQQPKRKRGRPRKFPAERPNDLSAPESEKTNGFEPINNELGDGAKAAVDEMASESDEQPLSMHPPNVSTSSRVSCCTALQCDQPNDTALAETPDNGEILEEHQDLPFVKSSPIWATLESLELYQTPPQKPHFSPLMKFKDDFREGLAIGHMVTFANVVERTSKLNPMDPKDIMESSLETLADLENHGFHVDALRARLNKLLSKKSKVVHLEDELGKVESQLNKCNVERFVAEQEIDQLEVKMVELQKKLADAIKVKNMKGEEIGVLKSKINLFSHHLVDAKLDFEKLAATPL